MVQIRAPKDYALIIRLLSACKFRTPCYSDSSVMISKQTILCGRHVVTLTRSTVKSPSCEAYGRLHCQVLTRIIRKTEGSLLCSQNPAANGCYVQAVATSSQLTS